MKQNSSYEDISSYIERDDLIYYIDDDEFLWMHLLKKYLMVLKQS
jgi:hypothetical protein